MTHLTCRLMSGAVGGHRRSITTECVAGTSARHPSVTQSGRPGGPWRHTTQWGASIQAACEEDAEGRAVRARPLPGPRLRRHVLYFFHSVSVDTFSKRSSSHEVLLVPVITLDSVCVSFPFSHMLTRTGGRGRASHCPCSAEPVVDPGCHSVAAQRPKLQMTDKLQAHKVLTFCAGPSVL